MYIMHVAAGLRPAATAYYQQFLLIEFVPHILDLILVTQGLVGLI